MTWMTPLLAAMSVLTTLRLVDHDAAAVPAIVSVSPLTALADVQLHDVGRHHLAGHDVVGEDARSLALFSGLSSVSTVPAGSLANASSVGANTVNGPGPLSVSTRPAAFERRRQRLERTGRHGGVDDVLGLCADRGRGERRERQCEGSQGSDCERFQHV